MRDLADSMEREADIREQLKFAEEEAESLRKKVLRIEDENESLMVQLKKMATKARSECETVLFRVLNWVHETEIEVLFTTNFHVNILSAKLFLPFIARQFMFFVKNLFLMMCDF